MCLVAKDDPVTRSSLVPTNDLKRNPNFILAMSDAGGHCEFYYRDREYNRYSRFTPQIVLKYFEQIYPYIKN